MEYALNANKKDKNYYKMEIIVSCEKLPKIGGLAPNTLAIIYLDTNFLEINSKEVKESSAFEPSKDNNILDSNKQGSELGDELN